MKIILPDEISYFQSVIEKLNACDSEELHEDNQEALNLIENAINPIVKDLSDEEAKDLIVRHKKILDEFVKESELTGALAFLQGTIIGLLAFKYNDYSAIVEED